MSEGLSKREKLELIMSMVERLEHLRANIANRLSIILSANAILIAGEVVLLDRVILSDFSNTTLGTSDILIVSVALLLALLSQGVSAFWSLAAIGYVWSRSDNLGIPEDDRIFFHGSSTREKFTKDKSINDAYKEFHSEVLHLSVDKMLTAATSEWWNGLHAHGRRYRQMRRSVRWISIALFFFTMSVATVLFNIIGQIL